MRKVSVVIPTRGQSEHLDKLITQLKKYQADIQIILVDNSVEKKVFKRYGGGSNVDCISLDVAGVSASRNEGARHALTPLIYFLDDDVELTSQWFSALERTIVHNNNDELISGGAVIVDKNLTDALPRKYRYLIGEKRFGSKNKVLKKDYLAGCNLMISKPLFGKLGMFPESYGHKSRERIFNEDVFFQEKARKIGYEVYYVHDLAVFHHQKYTNLDLNERVRLQGIYDRRIDSELNKARLLLRIIKYSLFLIVSRRPFIKDKLGHNLDLIRYRSYLYDKR